MSLYEHGAIPEAEAEKHRLEEKQRAARREDKENNHEPTPNFFEEIEVDNPWTNEPDKTFKYIEGDRSYWQRRETCDWDGLPDLF